MAYSAAGGLLQWEFVEQQGPLVSMVLDGENRQDLRLMEDPILMWAEYVPLPFEFACIFVDDSTITVC